MHVRLKSDGGCGSLQSACGKAIGVSAWWWHWGRCATHWPLMPPALAPAGAAPWRSACTEAPSAAAAFLLTPARQRLVCERRHRQRPPPMGRCAAGADGSVASVSAGCGPPASGSRRSLLRHPPRWWGRHGSLCQTAPTEATLGPLFGRCFIAGGLAQCWVSAAERPRIRGEPLRHPTLAAVTALPPLPLGVCVPTIIA